MDWNENGKTFFADCLLSAFDKSDIGYFQCPMGNTVSTFMYSNICFLFLLKYPFSYYIVSCTTSQLDVLEVHEYFQEDDSFQLSIFGKQQRNKIVLSLKEQSLLTMLITLYKSEFACL